MLKTVVRVSQNHRGKKRNGMVKERKHFTCLFISEKSYPKVFNHIQTYQDGRLPNRNITPSNTKPLPSLRIKHHLLDLKEFMTSLRTFITYIHHKCSAIKHQYCPDMVSTKKKKIL